MGKLVASFVFFLAASALAVHEATPPPPPRELAPPRAVDEPPPSRAIHDDVPPWVKYAPPVSPPPPIAPAPPLLVDPARRVLVLEPPTITVDDGESADVPDAVDRCPDQPSDGEDDDGCPEPAARAILID